MLLKQMRYFVSVVDNNSFTEAANDLFISQSAISQQIQALESELGIELLRRQHRKFIITPAGHYFYRESKRILSEVDTIIIETKAIGEDEESQLNVGYLKVYNGLELHQAIAEFTEIYPEVSLNIINGTHEELYQELRQNTVDVVLSDQRRAFSEDYHNFELVQPEVYIELSTRNKLSEKKSLEIRELNNVPCILVSSLNQQTYEEDYYRNTLGFNGSFLFAESLDEARMMVINNQGVLPVEVTGTIPMPSITIKRVPIIKNGKPLRRNYCAFWNKSRSNYYIEEFVAMLHNFFESNITT